MKPLLQEVNRFLRELPAYLVALLGMVSMSKLLLTGYVMLTGPEAIAGALAEKGIGVEVLPGVALSWAVTSAALFRAAFFLRGQHGGWNGPREASA